MVVHTPLLYRVWEMSQLPRPKNVREEDGFTLMEVLVALTILTIGLMSIALLMANVYKSTVRSRYMALASMLASEKLEDLSSYALSDPRAHLAGGSLGALPAGDVGPVSATWNSTTLSVDYYDTVTLNNSSGGMNETFEILNGSAVQYVTQSFTANGELNWDSTDGPPYYPSKPTSTAPTGETFNRQWLIQSNTPVTGLTTITVLVTLMDNTVSPPVTFQLSMVRP
jgi:prepilin-type N-terminal cleavage/methylation domain-containing protein